MEADKRNTWDNLLAAFEEEFRLLWDNDEIVTEIYCTRQGKNEYVRAYSRRLKELIGKLDNKPMEERVANTYAHDEVIAATVKG